MSLLKFPHPKVINENFIFKNGEFHNLNNENEKLKILEYSENTQGWNDELTKMADHDISNNHPIDDASIQMCLDLLQKYEKSEKKIVLEIGCLNGNLTKKIINTQKYYYIGSDAINNSIQNLSKIYKDNPFIVFDILKNPFKKSICNTLIMLNVLEHVEDDDKALAEAYNMLENDGLLIIEVPAGKFLYDDYDRQLLHYRRYGLKEITNKLLKNGFTIVKKTHLGFFIFPFFVVVKMINKILKNKNIVVKQTKITDNFFIKFLFYIEKKLENFSLPFGIRCVICAKKK
jgi:SAM-dependent methyltransferase